MSQCERCGEGTNMPYSCSYCGRSFCKNHRLPENHDCVNRSQATSPSTANVNDGVIRSSTPASRKWIHSVRKNPGYALAIALVVVLVASLLLL